MANSILACVDGSIYMDSVCDHAAWACGRLGAPLQLIHTQSQSSDYTAPSDLSGAIGLGVKSSLLEKLAQVDEDRSRLEQKKGRLILEHATQHLAEQGIGEIETIHRRGSLVESLAELEANSQLVVLGKRGEHADFDTLMLGSNLERVARSTNQPMLVASRGFRPIERFVVAYDGGSSTRKALDYLTMNPLLQGMTCHLLQVGANNENNRNTLAAAAAKLEDAGYDVQSELQQGDTDEVIADYVKSDEMDLLIMGAYGHSAIRTFLIGSTTSKILQTCLIPVLMFR